MIRMQKKLSILHLDQPNWSVYTIMHFYYYHYSYYYYYHYCYYYDDDDDMYMDHSIGAPYDRITA